MKKIVQPDEWLVGNYKNHYGHLRAELSEDRSIAYIKRSQQFCYIWPNEIQDLIKTLQEIDKIIQANEKNKV